jgi:helix-turn-helix protein
MAERLNFREACQHAGVSRQRLNEAIRSGRLPAERGGGPGKPTYIHLEDLQAWCVSEGLAMPMAALERSERPNPEELTAFLQQFRHMVEAMERLEHTVEQAIERLERSQVQAIEQDIAQARTQLRAPLPLGRSEKSSELSKAPTLDREGIIARIRHAKDIKKKS